MFILNQSKDAIVNTDNIIEIYAIGTEVKYQDTTIQFGLLGIYPDSVRAAEIVRDILDNRRYYENIYEMPEE